jgi:peptidoglycan/xylan/chitin deacetylase (PgdA/CDA1 family)
MLTETINFNGDGKSDILWRNNNGDTHLWNSNSGSSVTFAALDLGIVGNEWHIQEAAAAPSKKAAAAPSKKIALTFDDGPDPTFTPQVLQVLQSFGVKATFFELGEMVLSYPDQTRAVVSAGDLVENHSFDHPDLITLSNAQIRDQLQQTSDVIFNITDTKPQYFRPPYGSIDNQVESIVESMDMKTTLWTVDTNDWQMGGVDGIVQAALNGATDGGIILMHDGGGDRSQTVNALDDIIVGLHGQGYEFVTIDQILNLPPWDMFV